MKLFGVDISAKWIFIEVEGKKYSIYFHDNLRKGIHDISVHEDDSEKEIKITGTYPPLRRWLPDIWRIWLPLWIKWKFKKFPQSHN